MTPHISAKQGDFAKTVLMPGDPLRAQYIAEKFLQNVKQVTGVRNMLGFTGTYKGVPVSVMGSGMGIPSISIYAHELYTYYNVENIIRVGSCGAIHEDLNLKDIVIAMGASTDSSVNRTRFAGLDFAAIANFTLLENAVYTARQTGANVKIGNVLSADLFYSPINNLQLYAQMGIYGIEMEAAGLYGVAAENNKNALAIMAVSDHIFKKEELSAEERQTSLGMLIEISLESILI